MKTQRERDSETERQRRRERMTEREGEKEIERNVIRFDLLIFKGVKLTPLSLLRFH